MRTRPGPHIIDGILIFAYEYVIFIGPGLEKHRFAQHENEFAQQKAESVAS